MLGDAEAGTVVEESEAGNDPALLQVGLGVLEEKPAERHDSDNGDDLEQPRAHLRIVQERSSRARGISSRLHNNPLGSPGRTQAGRSSHQRKRQRQTPRTGP